MLTDAVEDIASTNGVIADGTIGVRAAATTKKVYGTRGIKIVSSELWGYATWNNRSVSFDDDVFLDYWGTNISVDKNGYGLIREPVAIILRQKQEQEAFALILNCRWGKNTIKLLILKCGWILSIFQCISPYYQIKSEGD
ncbi:MAG: hypothetical protein EOM28_03775 [Clostridia bacterium]|nr:hypothetical protein [Clostridia bacterium]